jgi:phage repressor protein C with HTH and peptisase S24 domain
MVKAGGNPPQKPGRRGAEDAERPFDSGLSGRLAVVINAFKSRQDAAAVAGVVADQLGRYMRGASQPSFETVARLAAARGFSLDWLWSGTGQQLVGSEDSAQHDDAVVSVPIMDVRAGAGGGEQFVIDEAPISALSLPRAFLLANGIKPTYAKLMFCAGDSMEHTIHDGSPMIIDTSDQGERDDVYVMRRGSGVIVKRLQHMADGSLMLKSDNPAYEPERLPRDEADELSVIGRVGMVLQSI